MLWIQIAWTICLFGAELCYTNQNLEYYDYNTNTNDISHRYRIMLCAIIMSRICKRFDTGGKPLTAIELREETKIPIRIVNDLLYKLIEIHLVAAISVDEKGDQTRYMPAENIENLSLGIMIDRLESQGKWKIDLDLGKHYGEFWSKALELRCQYLKELRNLLLKNF